MIEVRSFCVGALGTNSYLLTDSATGESALVDPGDRSASLSAALSELPKGKLRYILLTHGHFDHISGALYYSEKYNADIVISRQDSPFLRDSSLNLSAMVSSCELSGFDAQFLLSEGDTLTLGDTKIRFILTPGHTQGSGCYIIEDDRVIFSGDTLFCGSMGRTDFPTGSPSQMMKSLHRLRNLEGDYKVYPGHNMSTTLDCERDTNIYLR
ncbi:MAG: MBL fold metallo-hydrolase [Ruminococcus sp.]|nr:MBL fold metallo-hydrolase [Ruminococcus sp.]